MSNINPAGSDGGSSGGSSKDSPSTAMIILYSITGIVTTLFLGIIVTGAVRAHRHPERYGPRRIAGRIRQSRAKGIARAMLDTIPIVKFGDPHGAQPDTAKTDVELGLEGEVRDVSKSTEHVEAHETHVTDRPSIQTGRTDADKEIGVDGDAKMPSETSTPADPREETSYYVCPICTDDFVKGQDVRVLPCNHQYHPECVDPWLVNVSGTCPLCRTNLNPSSADGTEEDTAPGSIMDTHPADQEDQQRQHRGLGLLMFDAFALHGLLTVCPEERILALRAALRRNQEETPRDENVEERRRRGHGLTSRLRDRFRIRTRRHGESDPPAA